MAEIFKITPVREVEVMPKEDYESPELKIAIEDERHKLCFHEHIKIFEHHRLVVCRDCGATLDAFDHLLNIGKREGSHLSSLPWARVEWKRLRDEADRLKNEISRLKSQRKRLV